MAETKLCPFYGISAAGASTSICVGNVCKFWDDSGTVAGYQASGTALTECIIRVGFMRLNAWFTPVQDEDVG